MQEIWKIPDEYPDYEVSNYGKVRRVYGDGSTEEIEPYSDFEIIKVKLDNYRGVEEVALGYLVMSLFDPYRGPGGWSPILYLDEDPWNCSMDNMRWKKKNMREIYEAKERKYIEDHKIYCYENDTVYDNATIATQELGLDRSRITKCCLGGVGVVNDYHFSFFKNREMVINRNDTTNRHEKVYCYETDTIYDNETEAANALGLNRTRIVKCCINREGVTGGYHFVFAKDKDLGMKKLVESNKGKKVYCKNLEDGSIRIFRNQKEAIDELRLPSIKNVLSGRQKTAGNYICSYNKEDIL